MAHNLEYRNGRHSMFSVKEVPWHGLGKKLDKPATAAEAIEAAQLDYEVEKRPVHFPVNGDLNIFKGHYVTVRKDNNHPLGIVGERYTVLQNIKAFEFFDGIVDKKEAIYHTAGVLGNGSRMWLMAKLPDYIEITNQDIVDQYLLLSNSHDGSQAVSILFTPIRVVCQNTLSLAISKTENHVRLRHTININESFKNAVNLLGIIKLQYKELGEVYRNLSKKELDKNQVKESLEKVFPINKEAKFKTKTENMRKDVLSLYQGKGRGSDLPGVRGTAWSLYNSFTEYSDYYKSTKGSQENRLKSVWFGSGSQLKQKALDTVLAI